MAKTYFKTGGRPLVLALLLLGAMGGIRAVEITESTMSKVEKISAGGVVTGTESIFFAYNGEGGTNVPTSETDLPWDTEVRKDANYTHTAASAEISVSKPATYLVLVDISAANTNTVDDRSSAEWYVKVDPNGKGEWAEAAGSRAGSYHRIYPDGNDTAQIFCFVDLNDNGIIKVCGISNNAADVDTIVNGCRIFIRKM